MSWFGSIVNALKLNDEDDSDGLSDSGEHQLLHGGDDDDSSASQQEDGQPVSGGVKEDLNEITKTLTRQFWGVASFLAPPPPPPKSPSSKEESRSGADEVEVDQAAAAAAAGIDGIRSDFAEIGGRFKSGITMLSGGTKAVSELSKMANSILQFGLDQRAVGECESGSAIGVTEEVVNFVKNIVMHPETWLDFPLTDNDPEQDEFDMSDAQQEHALAVENLVPELAALRLELCPEYISEGFFWKIYFVLVHPRLDKHDADLISTAQILETRAMLTRELQNRKETAFETDISEEDVSYVKEDGTSSNELSLSVPTNAQMGTLPSCPSAPESALTKAFAPETVRRTHSIKSIEFVDKSVVKEEHKTVPQVQKSSFAAPSTSYIDNDEDHDWLKEEPNEAGTGAGSSITIPITNEEEVSFSDLEEEDDTDIPHGTKNATDTSDSSTKSRDWVQLTRSSSDSAKENKLSDAKLAGSPNKESNDWLNVEDIDEI